MVTGGMLKVNASVKIQKHANFEDFILVFDGRRTI